MSIGFKELSTMQGMPGSSRIYYGPWRPIGDNAIRVIYEDFLRNGKVTYTRVKGSEYRNPVAAKRTWRVIKPREKAVKQPK